MGRITLSQPGFGQRGVFDYFQQSMRTAVPIFLHKKRLEQEKDEADQYMMLQKQEMDAEYIKDLMKMKVDEDKAKTKIATDLYTNALEEGNQDLAQSIGPQLEQLAGINLPKSELQGPSLPEREGDLTRYLVPEPGQEDIKNTGLYNDLTKLLGREPTLEEYEKQKQLGQRQSSDYFTPVKTSTGVGAFNARTGNIRQLKSGEGANLLPVAADVDLVTRKKTAEASVKAQAEKIKLYPKMRDGYNSLIRQWELVEKKINQAIKQVTPFTAGAGAWASAIPATPQRNLRETIDTIKANIGFDKLQDMRNNSPTGGALGQVSEFENRLLQAVQGSLDQSQSASQLRANLKDVLDLLKLSREQKTWAYNNDFKDFISKETGMPTAENYLKGFKD